MSKDRDRIVYRHKSGDWINKRIDSDRASSRHDKQDDAIDAAAEMLRNQGGGELIIKGRDGLIRSKDTISPGSDPNPPKDREH